MLPYGNISNPAALGLQVRSKRRQDRLTQAELAALAGTGTRFISDLENGKATLELGRVLIVLAALGLNLVVEPRGWQGSSGSVKGLGHAE